MNSALKRVIWLIESIVMFRTNVHISLCANYLNNHTWHDQ